MQIFFFLSFFFFNHGLAKRDMRQEAGAVMVSWIDRAGDEAGDGGSSVGGGGEARGRLQAAGSGEGREGFTGQDQQQHTQ